MIEVVGERAADLDLLRGLPDSEFSKRRLGIVAASLALHLLFFSVAVHLPGFAVPVEPEHHVILKRTKLYLPPDVLTQRAPNRAPISKNIDLADLLSAPSTQAQRAAPRPAQKHFEIPKTAPKPVANAAPTILPEVPQISNTQPSPSLPPGTMGPLATTAPPPPKPVESPFQNIGSETPNANPTLKPPKADVQSTVQGLAQDSAGRHLVISDDNSPERVPGTPGSVGNNGGPHAAVELQSDPQGADFKAYLTRILAIVRANWRRVIPESARMGALRGRTTVEFIVNRNGSIPKVVIASSSGLDPLDRAAGAGLSMSNPLPPLPSDYRGFQVRLAFTFSYNMPAQ